MSDGKPCFSLPLRESVMRLGSTLNGLTDDEAARRLAQFGPNEIRRSKKRTPWHILVGQFTDFMILILIAAAIVSGIVGEVIDTVAILVIVLVNAIIGFFQEYRAEQAVEALRKMAKPNAMVKRSGYLKSVPASTIVPGDIILLEAGNIVDADIRLIEAAQLKVDESALTGESVPVEKDPRTVPPDGTPIGERLNMVYKGTVITYGRGSGLVVATGMQTELGRIATLLAEEEEVKTPLQRRLTDFGKKLAVAFLAVCAIVFVTGLLRGESPALMFLTAISLAVAAIPEALPAVITVALAIGAKKLATENALMRKLAAVETLGSVTYICSDKTGTLTQNRMAVMEVFLDGKVRHWNTDERLPEAPDFFHALALSNDAQYGKNGAPFGDPTEVALCVAAGEAGFAKQELERSNPRVAELPFDSERKCMTTFHKRPDGSIVSYTKGAIEVLLERSQGIIMDARLHLNPRDREAWHEVSLRMAADGLRVLGIAMRKWDGLPENLSPESVERDLILLGLVGMIDPPREEAAEAIRVCRSAGIVPVMITGDHPVTARAIAYRIGIMQEDTRAVVTGRELEAMSDEVFLGRVDSLRVYARVAPEQKLRIVKALQDRRQYVAMTGDGVNDAPALKRADIGVAMGITGTEVSKEASDMILLDDNFATIVRAIQEGRRIFDNIRKFIKYIMSCNLAEIWTIFLAPFLGLPIPLLPIQILWINLVTDSLPSLALAVEPAEAGTMQRPPRHPSEGLFARGLGLYVVLVGMLMAAITLGMQAWAIATGRHWQTMTFTVLCLSQMGNAMAIRSDRELLMRQGIFTNWYLLGAVVLTFGLQLLAIYVPFMNGIFRTVPLTPFELLVSCGASALVFGCVELTKLVASLRRRA